MKIKNGFLLWLKTVVDQRLAVLHSVYEADDENSARKGRCWLRRQALRA